MNRFEKGILFSVQFYEVLLMGTVGAFVLSAYVLTGKLPAPYAPDPSDVSDLLHTLCILLLLIAPWVVIAGLLYSILTVTKTKQSLTLHLVFWSLSCCVLYYLFADPFTFNEWIFD